MKSVSLSVLSALLLATATTSLAAQSSAPAKTRSAKPQESAKKASDEKAAPSPLPDPDAVLTAMKKATSFFRREVAFAGGYAWQWPQDMSIAKGENRATPTLIMMQPPGTPAVGLAMLEAYKSTGDKLFLQGAKEAAQALMWCQLATGGWDSDFDFDPRKASRYHFRRDIEAGDIEPAGRHGDSTLDDNKTQSALLFLLELAHTDACKGDPALRNALKFGFDGLLKAQAPNGGWGQHYTFGDHAGAPVTKAKIPAEWPHLWPAIDYTRHYTLNDDNLMHVMRLLLRAHELEKDERYLAAALKLGDFLLLAQLPEPQPGWAQQYDRDMVPVWARKFEPPAVSSVETEGAVEALIDLWVATGEKKYVQSVPAALAWLERSKLPDGRWPRFYELATNKPLYCKANTYEVTFDDSDLPTHYGFKIGSDLGKKMGAASKQLAMTREELQHKGDLPSDPKSWARRARSLVTKVTVALSTQTKKGAWLSDDLIDAGSFVKHLRAMSSYVESARKGGAAFETLRQARAAAGSPPATRTEAAAAPKK